MDKEVLMNKEVPMVHKVVLFVVTALAIALTEKAVQSGYQKLVLDKRDKLPELEG